MNWNDDFIPVSYGIQVKRYIIAIAVSVTFTRGFTRDIETEGHAMVYVREFYV